MIIEIEMRTKTFNQYEVEDKNSDNGKDEDDNRTEAAVPKTEMTG